jgi:hypothetical protein
VRNQSPSLLSRVSGKRNSINPANDIERRSLCMYNELLI